MRDDLMRVKFVFDLTPQSGGPTLSMESLARACIELQRLWVFMVYLAFEEISIVGNESFSDFDLLRYLLADPLERRLNLFVENDFRRLFWPVDPTLDVQIIRYASPLQIEAASKVDTPVPVNTSRLKRVFKILMQVLTIDLLREKAHWETEIARQRALKPLSKIRSMH